MAQQEASPASAAKKRRRLQAYWPLVALIAISALAAKALTFATHAGAMHFMHYFMGLFFCAFAMLKIFNPAAFAKGFRMYDLIAIRVRPYAFLYPFIELALGLAYLSFVAPTRVYEATIAVMAISALGVALALRKGLNLNCPCMGNILQVPLSTVTLTEDIGMLAMALLMLFLRGGIF